jgi:mRNA interferase MazF
LPDDDEDQRLRLRGHGQREKPPSAVLADQLESLDWRARRATRKGVAEPRVLSETRAKLKALLAL